MPAEMPELAEAMMGVKYRLRFATPDSAAVASVLRQHHEARDADATGVRFDFGSADGGWPQASACVEGNGAYFCDHCCGRGRVILDELVARLTAAFGPVVVEEL